ncbi:MAG TPA: glutathione transferase [Polyangiaceae bacterium]|nr:glutathione transferase [Polyangiaceae bacterium]
MILYDEALWHSPYVFSVFVALTEKGIPFERRTLTLERGDQRTDEYRAASLTARVPAVEHEGFVLSESQAIVEWLEEAFPAPKWPRLLPEKTEDRARARQVMAWLRSDLLALREERSTDTMFFERARAPLGPAAKAAAEKLLFVTSRLVAPGRTTLFSDWSIADADLGFMLERLVMNGDPVPDPVRAYAEAQFRRPSVRAYVEHDRPKPGR